jgi:hypothetical protein
MIEGVAPPNPGQLAQLRESLDAHAEAAAARREQARQSETATAIKPPGSSEAHREEDGAIKRRMEQRAPAAPAKTLDDSVGRNLDVRA